MQLLSTLKGGVGKTKIKQYSKFQTILPFLFFLPILPKAYKKNVYGASMNWLQCYFKKDNKGIFFIKFNENKNVIFLKK